MKTLTEVIGYAKFKDINKFINWINSEDGILYKYRHMSKQSNERWECNDWEDYPHANFVEYMNSYEGFKSYIDDLGTFMDKRDDTPYKSEFSKFVQPKFETISKYLENFDLPWNVVLYTKLFTLIKYNNLKMCVPNEFLEVELLPEYSGLTMGQLVAISGDTTNSTSGIIPANYTNVSKASVESSIEKAKTDIEAQQQEIEDKRREMNNKIEEARREIQEKYSEMLQELQNKETELKAKQAELKVELFKLDTAIYGIRCFMGEVINFTKIKSGKPAKVEDPIILYQKMRFLDEEFGKYLSIYDIGNNDVEWAGNLFEDVINSREDILELFCPTTKCISVIRMSASGVGFQSSDKLANMLKSYKLIHGTATGILIRNGDNVYIGWTDEERVHIPNGDVFLKKQAVEVETDDEAHVESDRPETFASRYFVLSILQGALSQGKIISVPDEVNIMSGAYNPYIIYSLADNFIEDNRFGKFADIMDRCNVSPRVGDKILTTMDINPQQKYDRNYVYNRNDRGIGYADRTHDVSVDNNTLYSINLILKDVRLELHYTTKGMHGDDEATYRTCDTLEAAPDEPVTKERIANSFDRLWNNLIRRDKNAKEVKREQQEYYNTYVSLEKEGWSWLTGNSGSKARANFLLNQQEYVNLTFLNSIWVQYAIMNKNVGKWYIGGEEVSYAYSLKYLNTIKQYLLQRETEELETLLKVMHADFTLPDEWQVQLSEFKLEKNIHNITEYQAKRFINWLKQQNS